MKLVFFEIEPWMQPLIEEQFGDHEVRVTKEPLSGVNAQEFHDAQVVSVFVFSKVGQETLKKMPQLKMISARSTGFDHIDMEAAKKREIVVTNVPKYGSVTVAEHTWALILAVSRNIYTSYERTEQTNFSIAGLRGFDLEGKTLGLIGLGEIGQRVALMSKGFSMKLRVFNRSRDTDFMEQFADGVYVDRVEDIYTHSDIISFHVPLAPETFHMLNLENYSLLKKGCVVINTSRGALIDTRALIKALKEEIVRGAGLDVLESEGVIKNQAEIEVDNLPQESELAETVLNHMLIGLPNVVITPHNAFNSDESIQRLLKKDMENVAGFMAGETETMSLV